MRKTPVRKTKADLEREVEQLRMELDSQQKDVSPKLAEATRLKNEEVTEKTKDLSWNKVTNQISSLRGEVSRVLTELSDKLVGEVQILEDVQQAKELAQAELARVHKMETVSPALDQMLAEYDREKLRLEEEMIQKRQEWADEQSRREMERKEYETTLKKQRERERADYEYQLAKERQEVKDAWARDKRLHDAQTAEEQSLREANWKEREETLQKQESEFARLRSEAEKFPKRLEDTVQIALTDNDRKWEERRKHETLLAQKQHEGKSSALEMKVEALAERLNQRETEIAALREELKMANKQVQLIAERAIEGASETRALSHINKIAMEQAKHTVGKA